jgi:methylenetetrahydrofolate reductase (NADPH)
MPVPQLHAASELHAIGNALRSASIETTARPAAIDEVIETRLAPKTSVYITALPSDQPEALVAAAARLHRAGLNPVPHLGARYFAGDRELEETLRRLAGEAAVNQVLVIAGDTDRARGPFSSSLELLQAGVWERVGIRRVGISAYPEGHPRIFIDVLQQALAAKIGWLRNAGLSPYVVTQFCFAPDPIRTWLSSFSSQFPDVPVHVGLAGPASVSTLLKYGLSCGVGTSLRALRRNINVGRLLSDATPLGILHAIARDPSLGERIAQFHFFTFGGIKRTAQWLRELVENDRDARPRLSRG